MNPHFGRRARAGVAAQYVVQAISFTASPHDGRYLIVATGRTMALSHLDDDGTTYEVWNGTGGATPGLTLAPDGGLAIDGASTTTFNRLGALTITKMEGAWSTSDGAK